MESRVVVVAITSGGVTVVISVGSSCVLGAVAAMALSFGAVCRLCSVAKQVAFLLESNQSCLIPAHKRATAKSIPGVSSSGIRSTEFPISRPATLLLWSLWSSGCSGCLV